jgi:hypothetical protein
MLSSVYVAKSSAVGSLGLPSPVECTGSVSGPNAASMHAGQSELRKRQGHLRTVSTCIRLLTKRSWPTWTVESKYARFQRSRASYHSNACAHWECLHRGAFVLATCDLNEGMAADDVSKCSLPQSDSCTQSLIESSLLPGVLSQATHGGNTSVSTEAIKQHQVSGRHDVDLLSAQRRIKLMSAIAIHWICQPGPCCNMLCLAVLFRCVCIAPDSTRMCALRE